MKFYYTTVYITYWFSHTESRILQYPILPIDRSFRQNLSREMLELPIITNQMAFVLFYFIFYIIIPYKAVLII